MTAGVRTQRVPLLAVLAAVVLGCTQHAEVATAPASTPPPAPTSQPAAVPRQRAPSGCAVTVPNGKGPPGEVSSPDQHGTGALWTVLPPDGIDNEGEAEPDGSTSQKYPWWTVGTTGQLTITGRRLDTPAPPLRARTNSGTPDTDFAEVADGRFWSSSITFPTEGCWQVTGAVGSASLTFVVLEATP